MRSMHTSRVKVSVDDCDLILDALIGHAGADYARLIALFGAARHRALTLRPDDVVDLPIVKPAALAALAHPETTR